jgi:hypothetical protein
MKASFGQKRALGTGGSLNRGIIRTKKSAGNEGSLNGGVIRTRRAVETDSDGKIDRN